MPTTPTKTPPSNSPAPKPQEVLMQMITGYWVSSAVYVAAKLALPDKVASGPRPIDELADETSTHAPSLYRLMRALASLGIFDESSPRTFKLGPLGQFLRTGGPGSMRSMALFQGAVPHRQAWNGLLHAVTTGDNGFEKVHGKGIFEFFKEDKEYSEAFNGAMTDLSFGETAALLDIYDFSGIDTLVDVGGGHGYLLTSILKKYPKMKGIVADLDHVVKGAEAAIKEGGLNDRCTTSAGSFFESVPAGDAYISKHILHDWSNEKCVTILENMRKNMTGDGKVLIIDAVIPPGNAPHPAKMLDLEMLNVCPGGKERTEDEFKELFSQAGLSLVRVIPTPSLTSVIEAKKT